MDVNRGRQAELLVKLYPRLLSHARYISRDHQLAEDLVQDAILAFLLHLDRGTVIHHPLSFIRSTIEVKHYHHIRKGANRELLLDFTELDPFGGLRHGYLLLDESLSPLVYLEREQYEARAFAPMEEL